MLFLLSAEGQASAKDNTEIPAKITPQWLRAQIQASGARAVVDRLYNAKRYDEISAAVAKGESIWLQLVPLIDEGTDASTAEDLDTALGLALPRNAEGVLKILRFNGTTIGVVCGAPFYETMQIDIPRYLRKATRAVEHIRDQTLLDAKEECLSALKEAASD